MKNIKVRGARQHNLKNINVDIPRDRLVVITGLSGSGKSTLAFDTLYAEGQRRYVESLSTYARQFLERMQKPDADLIEGLSPAIAIEQKIAGHNPRSTVGTATEIYDYLRLLFARVGEAYCYKCGQPITSQSIDQMVQRVNDYSDGDRIIILAPLIRNRKGSHQKLINRLRREGFARVRINGELLSIEDVSGLGKKRTYTIEVVVDRLILKKNIRNRLADSLELALSLSNGLVQVQMQDPGGKALAMLTFSEHAVCSTCGVSCGNVSPASFSFNSPAGACSQCDGLGTRSMLDPDLLVPDQTRTLREGAVTVWAGRESIYFTEFLDALTGTYKTDIYTPFENLPHACRQALFYGSAKQPIRFTVARDNGLQTYDKPFEGLIPQLERRYRETDSAQVREEIRQFMTFRPCPSCNGARLRKESLSVKIDGRAIHEITALTIGQVLGFFRHLRLDGQRSLIAEKINKETIQRLEFLQDVGLDYLTLDRPVHTLSGGESQRIRLATQIGAKLTGVLYVLDEPSIGLHQKDNRKLIQSLLRMRDTGNTVLVVEHDADTIYAADHVIDIGPGAGSKGGRVVFSGPARALESARDSLTGRYLSGDLSIPVPMHRRPTDGRSITVKGASHNNLKQIEATFPTGCLTCVTGVSGSGKSSLVIDTLYPAACRHLYRSRIPVGKHRMIDGLSHIDKVINIDQTPIGRTPRSNPGTYTSVFTFIRDLFSKTAEARMRGYKPGRFSFNVKGGRCEACSGDGIVKIEMHFLPDLYVPCDVCHGKRYNRETLEVRYKGKNIAEILDLTVSQALDYFKNIGAIRDKLQTLVDVGLGYIHLGQSATTLSGGEAQRIKLSRELSKKSTGRTLYILDEPTSGLHMDDINRLLQVLNRLVDLGNTVVVIEHNLDVIKCADHVIDLGPEGGGAGGLVIGTGAPEDLALIPHSDTGHFLKEILGF
jgi:excinuclease ABC subunit A